MKKIFISIIIIISSISSSSSHVEHYSNFSILEYDLFRNDKLIGFHKYNLKRNNNELIVESSIKFKIKKLGVDLYSYAAESKEIYKNNNLEKFTSKTKQNKKDKYVNISKDKDKELIIDGSSYKGKASGEFIVGTWWNHEIVKAKAQISAISGRVIQQNVSFVGKEAVNLNGKKFNALRFNFSSADKSLPDKKKLNTDIWYEEETFLWLKASFTKQGKWEYRLKSHK
ncbi:DUF6134 family protein [Pelagibacteraceae bacterium]|nr:DUF6134 family protein [Pelagibacteraceae bacterium]